MQTEGTLTRWNNEKDYGFITPKRGGQDIQVELSAFPTDGRQPRVSEKLSFTIETDKSGKKKAVQVQRLERKQNRPSAPVKVRKRANPTTFIASLALFVAVLGYGYLGLYRDDKPAGIETVPATNAADNIPPGCDGRTQCSQMTSCEEARFFLRNCPNVQLDGNGDGIPCEQQWCAKESASKG